MATAAPAIVVWLSLVFLASLFFRRRDPGGNPGFAGALQLIVPGVGYAYLHRWDHFLAAYLILIVGIVMLTGPLAMSRYTVLFAVLVYAGSVIDCIVTGYLQSRPQAK